MEEFRTDAQELFEWRRGRFNDATGALVREFLCLSGAMEHDLRSMWIHNADVTRLVELGAA